MPRSAALAALLLAACPGSSEKAPADTSAAGTDTGNGDPAADSAADTGENAATACTNPTFPETDFVAQGTPYTTTLTGCQGIRLVSAGAVNSRLATTLTGEATLALTDIAARDLGPSPAQLFQSGEFFIDVAPATAAETPITLDITCVEGCDRSFTRYPIVLMHGFAASGMFAGTDYFYEVRDTLEAQGYLVRNPTVSPFSSSQDRAIEWAALIDGYFAEGLGRKFNLIAHSQGGLDARYLVGGLGYGDRVASIDMIGTPNHGTVIADVLGGTITDGIVDPAIVDAGAAIFATLYGMDDSGSLAGAIDALTTAQVTALNADSPDDPNVYYSSWAGISCLNLDSACRAEHGDETIEFAMEPLFLIAYAYGLQNDGMVPVESAPWGEYMGELDADHADEIGAFSDENNPAFDHLMFYQSEAERLAGLGF